MMKTFLIAAVLAALAQAASAQTPPTHQHGFGNAHKWSAVFDDPKRDAWQRPHEVIKALALSPSAAVADIGAGTGYFSVRLARMLPRGRVFAVDAEANMVKHLENRARREGLKNMTAVAATATSAMLPAKVDVALFVDVVHHIEARERYFRDLATSLKEGGRVAIIDFRPDSPVGPPPESRLPEDRVKAALHRAGFALEREHGFLPNQYFLVFRVAP